jgi:hypothetical protein
MQDRLRFSVSTILSNEHKGIEIFVYEASFDFLNLVLLSSMVKTMSNKSTN